MILQQFVMHGCISVWDKDMDTGVRIQLFFSLYIFIHFKEHRGPTIQLGVALCLKTPGGFMQRGTLSGDGAADLRKQL